MNLQLKVLIRYYFLIVSTICLFIAYEWLNTITKPSFLGEASFLSQLQVLYFTVAVLVGVALTVFVICGLLLTIPAIRPPILLVVRSLLVIVITLCTVLFLNSILYSLTRVGTQTCTGIALLIPLSLITLLALDLWRRVRPLTATRVEVILCIGITLTTAVGIVIIYNTPSESSLPDFKCGERARSPNVIILSGDGISADRMSLYGYHRETTPFLDIFAKESLVFENAFSNSRRTTSSISSVLTGRSPLSTGVLYFPDILKGESRFLHLPGILKKCGYQTLDFTIRNIVDPYELNMQQSFSESNGRSINFESIYPSTFDFERLFLLGLFDKFRDFILHLTGVRSEQSFFRDILALQGTRDDESWKFQRVISQLSNSRSPLFANIHLMGTHGRKFFPRIRQFSKNETQLALWMDDFYDDAILDFDLIVKEFVHQLRSLKQLESTLLIITSDHAINSGFGRVPLLIHYPPAHISGRVKSNAQRLDIAPTILDLLAIPTPDWMEGQSLLSPLSTLRSIFFIDQVREGGTSSPFRNLESLGLVRCNSVATLNLLTGKTRRGRVAGHTAPCDNLISESEVRELLAQYMSKTRIGEGVELAQ